MLITIFMSTYNGEKYLASQLESIIAQDIGFENIRLIIRDDGSSDNTISIIKHYCKEYSNVILIEGENLGPAQSFWSLIKNNNSISSYYSFADQDDVWLPHKLSTAINKIKNVEKPAMFFGNAALVDDKLNSLDETVYGKEFYLSAITLLSGVCPMGCGMVFNNNAMIKLQESSINKVDMHDLTTALVIYLVGDIYYDSNIFMYYRQHENNVVGVQKAQLNFDIRKKIKKSYELWFERPVPANEQAHYLLKKMSKYISLEEINQLKLISTYKTSLKSKLKLLNNNHIYNASNGIIRSFKLRVLFNLF